MKKLYSVILSVFLSPAFLSAEPMFVEKADNVLEISEFEAGFSPVTQLRYNNSDNKHNSRVVTDVFTLPFYVRYAVTDRTEVYGSLYYVSREVEDRSFSSERKYSQSGLDDSMLGARYTIYDGKKENGWCFGVGGYLNIPTGQKDFRKGFDVAPYLAARKAAERFIYNFNLYYDITGDYNNENSQKYDPGDVVEIDGEIEYPTRIAGLESEICCGIMTQSVSSSRISGSNVAAENRFDALAGIRFRSGSTKVKLGIDYSLGNRAERLYDYRLIAGLTWLFRVRLDNAGE